MGVYLGDKKRKIVTLSGVYNLMLEEIQNMKIDLIWTNEDASVDFVAQTLNFNGIYKMYLLEVKPNTSSSYVFQTLVMPSDVKVWIDSNNRQTVVNNGVKTTFHFQTRPCTITESSISFETAGRYRFGDDQGVDFTANDAVIPYKIYGIK